jgi:hypothetical protein
VRTIFKVCRYYLTHAAARAYIAACVLLLWLNPGYAGLVIEGTPDKLIVDADQASLDDVIKALEARFNLRSTAAFDPNIRVSGHFNGSLNLIVRQLLRGYDFVITTRQTEGTETLDIILLGNSAAAAAPLRQAPPDPQLVPSRNDGFK